MNLRIVTSTRFKITHQHQHTTSFFFTTITIYIYAQQRLTYIQGSCGVQLRSIMGLIYVDILNIPRCMGTRILTYMKMMIMMAQIHLGLHKHSPNLESEESGSDQESQNRSPNYILLMDAMCPSPIPVPVHAVTACIKKRLPVVEFGQILDQIIRNNDGDGDEEEKELPKTVCPICLDCIERSHEIRHLSNCDHIFHRDCLDCWVDEGQLTCPLCRSMLFPAPAQGQRTILQEIHCMNINNN